MKLSNHFPFSFRYTSHSFSYGFTGNMDNANLFLFVVLMLLQQGSADDVIVFSGRVGGSVCLQCMVDDHTTVNRLYFQKENKEPIYINGFAGEILNATPYTHRTVVHQSNLSMEMFNLTVEDQGEYKCVVMYKNKPLKEMRFNLTVTADYSVTIENLWCSSAPTSHSTVRCEIYCKALGGFPWSSLHWKVAGENKKKAGGESMQNGTFWNVSEKLILNCSSHPVNVSCSVGGAVSQTIIICESNNMVPLDIIGIIACGVIILVFIFIVTIILRRKCRPQPLESDVELENLNSPAG